jgi:hypothetical protein
MDVRRVRTLRNENTITYPCLKMLAPLCSCHYSHPSPDYTDSTWLLRWMYTSRPTHPAYPGPAASCQSAGCLVTPGLEHLAPTRSSSAHLLLLVWRINGEHSTRSAISRRTVRADPAVPFIGHSNGPWCTSMPLVKGVVRIAQLSSTWWLGGVRPAGALGASS